MRAARILIAEDESLIAEELRERLERMGLTVTAVVASGEDAIAIAEKTLPDLLLMDIHLTGKVGGIAGAAAIRQRFDIPVVYLTALLDDATISRAKQTCPLCYLLKPVAERELRSAVEMALQYHGMELRQQAGRSLDDGVGVARAATTAEPRGFVLPRSSASPSPGWSQVSPPSLFGPALFCQEIPEQL
jgi:two-component system, response regulator PdtaR